MQDDLSLLTLLTDETARALDYSALIEALRHRTAELEVSNKELEAFAYSVSHDLRSPLRAIDGFGQALMEDYGDRRQAEAHGYLERIRLAAGRMSALIDDLLNLARVTHSELRPERVDLAPLAQSILADLQQAQPERQVAYTQPAEVIVNGDARLLRLVLENLLSNAWKFTGRRPQAEIDFGRAVQAGAPVYFVRDNGAGFNMEYANRLFEAFQRLHQASEFPGTGVGLATVQRIIQRHAGRVWAEGAEGQGATFYFTLDLPLTADPTDPIPAA